MGVAIPVGHILWKYCSLIHRKMDFFFLDGEEGLVLKADCGPILLHISEGEKKKSDP